MFSAQQFLVQMKEYVKDCAKVCIMAMLGCAECCIGKKEDLEQNLLIRN